VVRGAARDDHDAAQLPELVFGHAEPVEHEVAVTNAIADRLGDAFRLLVDLLQHERLVPGSLRGCVVPVDLEHVVLDRGAGGGIGDRDSAGLDRNDFAVAGELHTPCLGEERREIRGEEVLARAEPDDHRRLMPDPDEVVRVIVVDHDEREMALEPRVRGAHSRNQITVVRFLEQVRDDFGVGFGAEGMTICEQRVTQLAVVLDDAVQHDRELRVVTGLERVGVLLGHATMGRPAGVAEARRRL
jgi:hypothetical protein